MDHIALPQTACLAVQTTAMPRRMVQASRPAGAAICSLALVSVAFWGVLILQVAL